MSFLSELNESQYQAVTNVKGPVMIIAGPGSGKTRVLTYRIAYLMNQGIDPFRILALTFTNKAAAEMRERIEKMIGPEARNLYMGTFHAVFARILRMEAEKLGYPRNFTIYDTDDAKSLLKTIIREEGLNDKLYKPSTIYYRISNCKNSLIGPEEYKNSPELIADDESAGRPKMGELFEKYATRCFKAGAMDFDDLLFKMHELLNKFPEVLYKYQNRFHYVMIDEFQDTNFAQYQVVKKLSAIHENVCVVGDDAQSIYAFRGATIENILNFEKDYPDLQVFKLEQNYRSTEYIVNAANDVIRNNKSQLQKQIWTDNKGGDKIRVYRTASDTEEARMVADTIFDQKMRHHLTNNEFAILYRTNAQSRSFEEALRKLNIAYKIYGGTSFYQRKEVRDFLAYLRLTVNPNDEEALKRIINYPKRDIGQTTIDRMIVSASQHDVSLWYTVEHPDTIDDIQNRARTAIRNFSMMIKSFRAQLQQKNAYEITEYIGKTTGLIEELYKDKSAEGISRYENIQELLNGIKEYTVEEKPQYEEDEVAPESDLAAYLQQISLLTDQDEKEDDQRREKVKLMTVHAAKGLEFKSVFVVGLEENLFPSALSIYTREELEEERRLFYVAITRAKQFLTLSYALMRYKFGQLNYGDASRFIDEIGAGNVQLLGQKQVVPVPEPSGNPKWYMSKTNPSKNETKEPVAVPQHLTRINNASQQNKAVISSDLKNLQAGMQVMHEKFSEGRVVAVEGQGDNKIATIFFEGFGQKKIMLKFAKLQILV
jgi:DNA helicase-2/ATP-dependent DNA helicase PcrA